VIRGEEKVDMQLNRIAALGAVTLIAAACTGGSGATTAPTSAATSGVASAPASTAPEVTPVSIAAPTGLITAGKLTDCVDIEYSPMEFFPSADVTDPNQAIGFDVDAARAVADAFGLDLEVYSSKFETLVPDLQAGRCDILWSALYLSPERLQVVDGVGYMKTGHVLMVAAGNPKNIDSPTSLCGLTISIQSGGLVEKRSAEASKACTDAGKPAITIQGYAKVSDELQQIVVGRVDAVWETDSAVADFMLKNPDKYEVAYSFPRDDTYGVFYTKGNKSLGDALTAALKALKADGTLANIAGDYQLDAGTLEAIQ
jgi:polar amino acid transport system substrate-binding protein